MQPHWFKGHVAYTMAKYGMSMCVLGMAEEFRDDGIGVNALWPRTTIGTAAIDITGRGRGGSRTTDIMADAAYVMLTRDGRSYTGNIAIDEDVLREAGVRDFEQYSCVPGHDLYPDLFVDETMEELNKLPRVTSRGTAGTSKTSKL
ncbi:Hydroxysteroid dehydrogenase-like protein 2 [Branchiostoma belcheri]|nr:Hydroxysteroid dehydrogenase-like protein 2 [Branchiostoma belcheri]